MALPLLEVDGLRVGFRTDGGLVQAVHDVSFTVDAGELVCLVGESGSGKSVTAMTLLGLTRSPAVVIEGEARFEGRSLLSASDKELRHIRGAGIAMVFQDSMSSLNPVQRVGEQIVEQIRAHERVSRAAATSRAVDLLKRMGIPDAEARSRSYPHEFSGGMCQRVMIAMALSCAPRLLIADEPTTALDVTIQAQILVGLQQLCREEGIGILLVTHDLGVVAEVADRVVVMYAGRVLEEGTTAAVFDDPAHPYTWGLLGSMPRMDQPRRSHLMAIPGSPSAPGEVAAGCAFRGRCPHAFAACTDEPPLAAVEDADASQSARCWLGPEDRRRLRVVGGAVGLMAGGTDR